MASSSSPLPSSSSLITSSFSSTSSPCAACKFLRRKCQPDCVFAPYFPPDQPQKFVHVHRVFGASNVTKLLNDLQPYQRMDAVNSLAYEADMRLRDPVYGCVRVISILQHQLRQLQMDLSCAKSELLKYQNSTAIGVNSNLSGVVADSSGAHFLHVNHDGAMNIGIGIGRDQFFSSNLGRDMNVNQHMMMSYDGELAARLGVVNGGAYDTVGIAATMNSQGIGAYSNQFMKPSVAGGDERPLL